MSKFKKGDKCRLVEDSAYFTRGDTVVVVERKDTSTPYCKRDSDGQEGRVCDHRLELIDDHKFKVGDRVRRIEEFSPGDFVARAEPAIYKNGKTDRSYMNARFIYFGQTEDKIVLGRLGESVVDDFKIVTFDTEVWSPGWRSVPQDEAIFGKDIAETIMNRYPMTVPTHHSGYDLLGEWSRGVNRRIVTRDELSKTSKYSEGGIMATIKSIPKRLKKVLDKDYKAMYQLNWLNGDLERTSKGTEELMDFLIDKYKDDLGALARERVAELEKEDE